MSLLKALVLVSGQIVQLPSGDTVADFNTIANKPTTLAGYGIAASDLLTNLLTVDGAGSGLDADLLDGQSSAYFLDLANATGTLAAGRVATNSLPLDRLSNASATSRVVGRITAGAGAWEEITGANLATIITYTAADVLSKLLTVDGAGSGLDADLLDGQSSAFYQNADNLNAGTVANARISGSYDGFTNITLSGDLIASGSDFDIRPNTADGSDNTQLRLAGGGSAAVGRGGFIIVYGNEHSTAPGQVRIVQGALGQIRLEGDPVVTGDLQVNGSIFGNAAFAVTSVQANDITIASVISGVRAGSKTYDPPSTANLATWQTTVTVAGASVGDFCIASFTNITTQLWQITAQVSSGNTVTVSGQNNTGATVDLSSGTLRVLVFKS